MLTVLGETTLTTPQGGQGGKCPAHDANHHKDGAFPPLPRPQGEGKDLNDLARMVTVIQGRQPPTLQGDGGGLTA